MRQKRETAKRQRPMKQLISFSKLSLGRRAAAVMLFALGAFIARAATQTDLPALTVQAQPRALASADFDEDGVPDLAVGYANSNGGGILIIHRGNIDSLYPYGDALRNGQPPAFLPDARVVALPESPDFLGVGDFDADGHWDVVAAQRGSSALYFLQGDARSGFRAAERTELSGGVTALTTGDINRVDGLTDIVVGISGTNGAKALVFESPNGAIKATREVFDLPAAAASFALGQFAGNGEIDLAIAAADNLLIVTGRDRKLSLDETQQQQVPPPVIASRNVSFSIDAMTAGNFSGDGRDLALGANDGRIFLLTPPKVAVTERETAAGQVATPAMEGSQPGANAAAPFPAMPAAIRAMKESGPTFVTDTNRPIGDWLLSAVEGSVSSESARMLGRLSLIRARVSGASNDDLMVIGGQHRQLRLMKTATEKRALRESVAAEIAAEEEPVAVLPMRLNPDGIHDLVILKKNSSLPSVVMSTAAATFTVNTAADVNNDFRCDATYCSLRGAISAANANPGPDLIVFNIPGPGVHTINTVVGFSLITDPVTIDGYTQPGSSPNTLVNGNNAVLLIEINGAAAQQGSIGLSVFNGSNNVFRGLAIGGYRFQQGTGTQAGGFGIALHGSSGGSDNNFVEGCFVGTNAAGTVANPNNNGGVFAIDFADDNTFGGTTPAARNLLSGNGRDGRAEIQVSGALGCTVCNTGNKVQGNFIGTDITGTSSLEDGGAGVFFFAARNALIGGTAPGARNIISGKQTGISFQANGNPTHQMPGTLVQGNILGLDVNGDVLANSTGMSFGAVFDTTFGGTTPAAANTSSGNTTGIFFANNATNNLIQGNFIGTDVNGANKGNFFHGIFLSMARSNTIGGVVPGAGNVIAFTDGNGIRTVAEVNSNRNTFRGNSIHSNTDRGIDLGGDGVTPNDACDADTGPNELQNFPTLTDVPSGTFFVTATATNSTGNTSEFSQCVRAQMSGGNISIQGTMDSKASGTFTLDFYANAACDPSGHGEGQTYLGSSTVTTDGSCGAPINVAFLPPPPARLLNIATRMRVLTGDLALIGGFIITGNESKRVIIRGIGPSLAGLGVQGALANPTLDLFNSSQALVATNDDWRSNEAEVEATTIPPSHDLESAIVMTLAPGAYTAVLRGKDNTSGIGVVEVYDLNAAADAILANISSRGFVDTGDNVMIGGFIIGGNGGGNSGIVVRAIAPSLSGMIAGVLPDPTLELKDANGSTLVFNDDWQQSPQAADISARGLAPSDPLESALGVSLSNGAYTAIVRGKGGATGVAVVEIYNVE